MSLFLVLSVVWLHFVGDFVLQSDKMATQKSGNIKWLSIHVAVYASLFSLFGWKYTLINAALHWFVDFCTSRLVKYYYDSGRHWFFVIIGFDQAVHFSCLFSTLPFAEYELLSMFFAGC